MIIELFKNEKRLIPMAVIRRKKEDFKIDSVNCKVLDKDGNVLETGIGEINNIHKEVYYFLDTTRDYFMNRKNYIVRFSVSIVGLPKVIKGEREIKIKK
jgi:hypothetical protein